MLFPVVYKSMEELDKGPEGTNSSAGRGGSHARKHGHRFHEVTCVDLKKACQRTAELKRKADDAHERTRSHQPQGGQDGLSETRPTPLSDLWRS